MSTESVGVDRSWDAEKRDIIPVWPNGLSDQKDVAADAGRQAADAREARHDLRAPKLLGRAGGLGLVLAAPKVAADEDGITRLQAAAARMRVRSSRAGDTSARTHATRGRLADARPSMLALALAQIAQNLYDADTVDEVLLRIAECAIASIPGCDMASISLSEGGGNLTAIYTDDCAVAVDLAQYEAHQGPSLDAFAKTMVYAPTFPDERWPRLGSRPADLGVRSGVSYHLSAEGPHVAQVAMNLYSTTESAFHAADRDIGFVLAANAPLAARAATARDHAGLEHTCAFINRDVIGQAKGILMERFTITPDDAFNILRRTSQTLNWKLHHVAERLVETGELPAKNNQRQQ